MNENFRLAMVFLFCAAVIVPLSGQTAAQTKADRCDIYARNAMAATPTSTGPLRGAARGAVVGGVFGNAGAGAAGGAVLGTARRAAQKSHSYQYYYDSCMAR